MGIKSVFVILSTNAYYKEMNFIKSLELNHVKTITILLLIFLWVLNKCSIA